MIFMPSLYERIKIQRRIYMAAIRCTPAKFRKAELANMHHIYHHSDKPETDRRAPEARGEDL